MYDNYSPRLRQQLRQADKVAQSGKGLAAQGLYEQILAEFPDVPEAWAGLGAVVQDETRKRQAFEKALELDGENSQAQRGLAILNGEFVPEPEPEEALPPAEVTPTPLAATITNPPVEHVTLACYRHPERQTSLRCNRCNKPICIKCAQRTSVGYRCPECIREIEEDYYTGQLTDYPIAGVVALVLSGIAGYFVPMFGFFVFFLGAAVGTGIGRVVFYLVGRRRSRWLPHVVAGAIVAGAILPTLITVLLVYSQVPLSAVMFQFAWPALYAVIAAGSAFYQVKA